ncbi:NAD-dependent epimerase/dehydratase family protein [Pseudothauera rhizosphaerae]|uniref:NAD-dependent epimerase/dehydratase family protein n=1 Tax=Pseudothauera rhizosphaerae TaxID=2565932 RepID=A0A4S4AFW2_9RHOO|nr:NAD-dependent epimerase/dehydratase family protein [Pseudothauera rhizosphaerae]THF57637.1 NAD-dependent epimerase/dehydratase family protein [Pseudothauera rhizosphaerae]
MFDVVVTGSGGFIGQALSRRLRAEGREVLSVTHADGDVADAAFWAKLPQARALVHLAGRTYVPDSWQYPSQFLEANVIGTQRGLDWCRQHGARMVLASAYVYGIPLRLPIRETDPVNPNNPYAFSKRVAEQCCEFAARHFGVDTTVLRIFNVFGRGQRAEFLIPTLISQLSGKEICVMDLAPRRDYVYLPDVIDAFARALSAPGGMHILNIGSGRSYSVAEIIATLQEAAGTSLPVVSAEAPRNQEILDVRADVDLAARVLGWAPNFDLVTGVQDMLKEVDHG